MKTGVGEDRRPRQTNSPTVETVTQMIRTSKILLLFTVTALLAWLLPWAYDFLDGAPRRTPFTLYSTVTGEFSWLEATDQGVAYKDAAGHTFTEKEFDSLLPFFYYRQLLSDNRFPDSIHGIPVTPRLAQTGSFMFRSSPRQANAHAPGLYPLLESMSGRVDLESPDDVFRIDAGGMTFIDCATNTVKAEKSAAFTAMLRKKGFVFPARVIAGNPTPRKEYDEGFFITDSEGKLFHLKQTRGRPFVRAVELPREVEIARISVTEYRGRQFFAFLTDRAGQFYVLTTGDYALHPVSVPPVDPARQGVMIVGNPFDWTMKVSDPDGAEHLYAVDAADFSLLKELHYPAPAPTSIEKIGKYLFPFRLSFTSALDTEVRPRVTDLSGRALILGLVLAAAYCLIRRKNPVRQVPQCLFIFVFGLYAFLGLLLFSRR